MAFTKERVDSAVENATGRAALGDTAFTFATSTTPEICIPIEGDWTDSFTGSTDFTVDASAGTITCNFDGQVEAHVDGSFSLSGSAVIIGDFYLGAVDTLYGFDRNVQNANQYGSVSGTHPSLTVADGDVITLRISVASGTPTATFHNAMFKVNRIS